MDEGDASEDPGEEYLPLSTFTSEGEADEDDALLLTSTSADEDVARGQSVLRTALCELPGEMFADLAEQNRDTDNLFDAMARFCVFLCTELYRDGKLASTVIVYSAGVVGIS